MLRGKTLLLSGILIAAVAILLFRTEVVGAAPLSSSSKNCGAWSSVASPNIGTSGNFLYGIAAISSHNVWAVGEYSNGNGGLTLIEHWNGTWWRIVSSPNVSGTLSNSLSDIAALAARDIWAVGTTINSANMMQTLIEHWDGKQWSIVPSPNVPSMDTSLAAISAVSGTDIWAVGNSSGLNGYQTLIEHWDGTQWSIVPSPSNGMLMGVAAIATNNVWAVGSHAGQNGIQTLVEHWDGTQWSLVTSPSPGMASNTLNAVAAISPNNIWAVGDSTNSVGPSATYSPLIEQWNGTTWNIVSSPVQGTSDFVNGIAAVSANNIWAVGDYRTGIDPFGPYFTLIEHWNGTAWSAVPSPSPGSEASDLLSATRIPRTNNVWAAGFVQNGSMYKTLTEFYC